MTRYSLFTLLLYPLALLGTQLAAAQLEVEALWFETSPVVDGRLDDGVWKEEGWSGDFVLIDDTKNDEAPAAVQTRFKLGVDSQYLYLGAILDQPQGVPLVGKVMEEDGAVWGDDSLEVMIAATPSVDEYIHLICNSSGVVYDALRVQGGNLADGTLRLSGAEVATDIGVDVWTIEMAIPLAELRLNSETDLNWAINVARNSFAGELAGVSSFAHMSGGLHQPHHFVPMALEKLDVVPFLWGLSTDGQSRVVEKDGQLYLDTRLLVSNETNAYAFFDLAFTVLQEGEILGELFLSRGLDAGASRLFRERIPVDGNGEAIVDVGLYGRGSDSLMARLRYPVRVDYTPMRIMLSSPSYRNTIYATEVLDAIRGSVEINLPEDQLQGSDLKVSLEDRSGDLLGYTVISGPENHADFSVPLSADLMVGDYHVRASLQTHDDGLVYEIETELSRLGAPVADGREVRLDKHKTVVVDGQPFLPVGSMGIRPMGDLEIVAAQGYTVVHEYAFFWWKEEAQQAWLDRVNRLGMMAVIYPFPEHNMTRDGRPRMPLSDEEILKIREFILKWKDHPALLAWYLADEPELHAFLPERLEMLYQLCRETDPWHPTILLNYSFGGIDTYGEFCDILMPNPFPGFYKDGGARRSIKYAYHLLRRAAEAAGGTKGVFAAPQAFSWADLRAERSNERPPNLENLRSMFYQGVIAGSKGFIPYSYYQGRRHPAIRLGLGYLAAEMAVLKDAILAPGRSLEASPAGGEVLNSFRSVGDEDYLFVVNVTEQEQKIEISLPQDVVTRWHVVAEEGSLKLNDNGELIDTLSPLATRIYTTNSNIVNSVDLEHTLRAIESSPVLKDKDTLLPESETENPSVFK